MERASNYLGMPVALEQGGRLGEIQDLLLDLPGTRLVALVLDRTEGLIAPPNIRIEDDTAMLDSVDRLARGEVARRMAKGTTSFLHLRRMEVSSRRGHMLGQVEDCIIQGQVLLGLEVGDGLLHDLVIGRGFIPLDRRILFAREKIVVDYDSLEGPAMPTWNDTVQSENPQM